MPQIWEVQRTWQVYYTLLLHKFQVVFRDSEKIYVIRFDGDIVHFWSLFTEIFFWF